MKTLQILARYTVCCLTIGVGLLAAQPAAASSLDTIETLSQLQFVELSKNLSAATSYKSIAPPEPLGSLGFDIGLAVSSTDIDADLFGLASGSSIDETELLIARVQAHKGLPFGLDIGASLSAVPEVDASVIGAELRYAIVEGGPVTPAIGLRASYSQLQGIDEVGLNSSGLEIGISKGFLLLTPYASAGLVRSTANPKNIEGLSSETFDQRKYVLGVTVNLGFALTLEADRTGDFRTYSAKAGVRF